MNIRYTLTKEDYIEFNQHFMNTSKSFKKTMLVQRFGVSLIFLVFPFVISTVSDIPFIYWMVTFSIAYILWILFYPKRVQKMTKKRLMKLLEEGKNEDIVGERTLTVTEEGIEQESRSMTKRTKWEAFERIEETENLWLVYVGTVTAFLIPKKVNGSADEVEDFLAAIRQRIKK